VQAPGNGSLPFFNFLFGHERVLDMSDLIKPKGNLSLPLKDQYFHTISFILITGFFFLFIFKFANLSQ
jgi:hypothetical protein